VGLFGQARWRYALLSSWAVGWFFLRYETESRGLSDWLWFEFGARTIVHLNGHYATGGLQLYAHYPVIQVGPPPLVLVAALQWLPPTVVVVVMGIAMALAGVLCIRIIETVARSVGTGSAADASHDVVGTVVLLAGLVATACWAWNVAYWMHLDDVMAITLSLAAMAAISRSRPWWLGTLLIGLAVASKPWAIVMTPILFGLPREQRAKSFLVMLAALAAPWLPFVLGDQHTVGALAGFRFTVDPRAAVHALGVPLGTAPHWSRPLQLLGGTAVAAWAVRRGRWAAVPLLALGFRVVSDPQSWSYYGLGPLMGAVLWDAARVQRHGAGETTPWWRELPVWTVSTAVVEFGVRAVAPHWAGWAQLAWFGCVVASVLLSRPTDAPTHSLADSLPAGEGRRHRHLASASGG
jgi:hypothetical protein